MFLRSFNLLTCNAFNFAPAKEFRLRNYRFFSFSLALIFFCALLGTRHAWASELDSLSISLELLQNDPDMKNGSLIFGLFMGVMLTAAAYLFFIWIVMRERGQVFLLCLLLSLSIYIASTNDAFMSQMNLSGNIHSLIAAYSMILCCFFSLWFTYYFLEVDVYSPNLTLPMVIAGLILMLLLMYASVDLNQNLSRLVLPTLCTLTVSLILMIGVIALRQAVSGSMTHVTAFLFLLSGVLADPLYDLGYIQNSAVGHTFIYISFSMAALMFAIVIASQFAARQEEKEKALALSNERFTLATRGSNEGLFDWNLHSGEVFFSEQFRKILNQRFENTPEGLKIWMRMIVDSDRRIVRDALRRFRHNHDVTTINIEYRVNSSNNTRRWLHTKAVAVRDATKKNILRLVGSTNDITARKQSEVALRASEARFRSITEAHPVPVLIVSLRNGVMLYASPGAEQLLGLGQDQMLNELFHRILPDEAVRNDIWKTMSESREINLKEVSLTRGDGRKIDAALSARRISYQSEDAMVIGLYDLTERKQAEAKITHQQEALQQSEKMAALGGLLAGVAHELNNPLSVVVGQTTLLMEGSTEPKVIMRAEKIFKAADRCARIVKSFLALARRKPPERKLVDVNAVISAALELLGYQIRTGNIIIDLGLAPDLPGIMGDSDQLTQVITNLVMNASQAMENWQGPRRISVRTRQLESQVSIIIADTGPGIPGEIRARIFEPFFTTKSSKGGTGVGLSLCLNIIASHDGQITFEDTKGGGATFVILLPVTDEARNNVPQNLDQATLLPQHMKILLVDDELEIAQTLADLLEPEGHNIDIAVNGSVALEKLRRSNYDMIISDLRMPVLDGPGLYEALQRELPSYLDKIIYVTGDTLSSHVQSFLSQYAVQVVEKPYRLSDVRQAIATALHNAPSQAKNDQDHVKNTQTTA